MNGKAIKKIRREINSSLNCKEDEIANQIFDYFRNLPFKERVKIAIKIIRKKI